MTEPTGDNQMPNTPGQDEGTEPKEETYTKAQFTELIQKEIAKVTAKNSKKLEALQAELEAERRKSLPDPEKIKLEIEERDKKLAESTAKIAALEASILKQKALSDANLALPEGVTLTELLDMMPGNSEEEISGYIERFKKMFPASRGLGTSTTLGASTGKSTPIVDQIRRLEMDMLKLETPLLEKEKMAKEVIRLKGKLAKGET